MSSKILRYFCHPRFIIAFFLRSKRIANLIPDIKYVKWNYRLLTGESLDLENPKGFRQKIQWLKLYDRNPEYIKMVDKVAVKQYVSSVIGSEYIIPTIAVYNSVDEIDFASLPKQFVLKATNGGGSIGVVICKDKEKLNISTVKKNLQKSLSRDIYLSFREWPYQGVQKKILAEKFMSDTSLDQNGDLKDYKIFCFNGVPKYIQVIQNRSSLETIDFFDTEWIHQDFVGLNPKCKNASQIPQRPLELDKMVEIASKLSTGIPFVRVDLYDINNHIYFGELTFYPNSGLGSFTPEEYDDILGNLIKLK